MENITSLPKAKFYHLVYRKANGQCKSYRITNPLETTDTDFTTYCKNHGIRKFKLNRVVTLTESK
jgi:hypothetical protein